MVFTDVGNAANAQPEDYQVSTVNKEGLESKRTQGISMKTWIARKKSVWTNLSDADFLTHWEGPDGHKPRGWKWENEILSMSPHKDKESQTSLYSKEIYGDFEFQFQFRIGNGGNSGVKYRMQDYDEQFLGPEYQILDDQQHYPGYNPAESTEARYITGTLYVLDMGDWNLDPRHPPGTWNAGRIISNGNRIEHWINGVKIVDTRTHTEEFNGYSTKQVQEMGSLRPKHQRPHHAARPRNSSRIPWIKNQTPTKIEKDLIQAKDHIQSELVAHQGTVIQPSECPTKGQLSSAGRATVS